MTRAVVLALLALTLGGCVTMPETSNRIVCTVSGGEAFTVSQWGPVGLTGRVHQQDAGAICRREGHEHGTQAREETAPAKVQRPIPAPQGLRG